MLPFVLLLFCAVGIKNRGAFGFVVPPTILRKSCSHNNNINEFNLGLGEYSIDLEKPLGMVLEERDDTAGGVKVQAVLKPPEEAGSAWTTGKIAPCDVLLAIDGVDVSGASFETVMDMLVASKTTRLTLGDGLGTFDMPPNVVKRLGSTEEAYFVDAVVRQSVREMRRDGRLGDLLRVEVVVGAGVREGAAMVRFFAIFSTDGATSYSCNVSAKGIQTKPGSNDSIQILSLSCAKDEGLGRTYDLIQE